MPKARIWRGIPQGVYSEGGKHMWYFSGFGYWAEACTFNQLMKCLGDLFLYPQAGV